MGGDDASGSCGLRKMKALKCVVKHDVAMEEQREVNAVEGGDEEEWKSMCDDNQ
jgi:hypothetical protein